MPKAIDLTGQVFGELTVIKQNGKTPQGEYQWLCQCSCGNQITVRGYNLRKGHTRSCGCIKNQKNNNLIGQKINHLTVINKTDERDSSGCVMWLCQCDCGKQIKVPTNKLTGKKSQQSCGCQRTAKLISYNHEYNKKDILGQRFGKLVVIKEMPERSKDKQIQWLCQCDCGNTTIVRSADLRNGNTKSCGCSRTESFGETKIAELLQNNHIIFEREKTFESCRFPDTNHLARFDFFLPTYNRLIEYNGIQHYIQGNGLYDNKEKFQNTQKRDIYKQQWCKQHGITLVIIPYTKYDSLSIHDLLD